jgi:hypothetical protein
MGAVEQSQQGGWREGEKETEVEDGGGGEADENGAVQVTGYLRGTHRLRPVPLTTCTPPYCRAPHRHISSWDT